MLTSFSLPFSELSLVGHLTWLTNHRPSVLCHCWLGYLTHKTVSEMTYNVSNGTLNSTIPYRNYVPILYCFRDQLVENQHFFAIFTDPSLA